ncbi:hypothetical protein BTO05_01745 [Winogradskyella sp. PC-19]|nr:hypothetical protein BTO05_01745 [Winogradskyella sp. PC-19]
MTMIQTNKIYWADKLGIVSAILCMIHCLAVPTLLTMGISFLNNPVIAILFILIAFVSIYKTTKRNFYKGVSVLLWIAFAGFVISIILEERAQIFQYTMYLSSVSIIIGHLYSIKSNTNQ